MSQLSLLQEQNKDEKDVEDVADNECLKPIKKEPTYTQLMIAKRFRLARDLSGYKTEAQAIERMGFSNPKVISQIENCHRLPTLHFVIRASNAYGVSTDYLLGLSEDDDPSSSIPATSAIFRQNQKVLNMIGNVLSKTSYSYAKTCGEQTTKALIDKIDLLYSRFNRFKELNPEFLDMRGGAPIQDSILGVLPLARTVKKRIEEKEKLIELHNEQLEHILQRKLALEGV